MPAAQTAVSLVVLAAATLALAARVEPLPTWYYHVAWWSYIVAIDGENRRLSGRSMSAHSRQQSNTTLRLSIALRTAIPTLRTIPKQSGRSPQCAVDRSRDHAFF